MSKIRKKYWLILAVWLIFFVGVFVSNLIFNYLNFQDVGILLAGISLGISLFALGLADQKKQKFNGTIDAWSKRVVTSKALNVPSSWYDSVKVHIINKDKDPIQNFTVSMRVPEAILHNTHDVKYFRTVRFGESSILIFDILRFLGVGEADNFIRLQPAFLLDNWNKGNIFITISGDNISPTTFTIKLGQKEELINSSPNNKLKLSLYG